MKNCDGILGEKNLEYNGYLAYIFYLLQDLFIDIVGSITGISTVHWN